MVRDRKVERARESERETKERGQQRRSIDIFDDYG